MNLLSLKNDKRKFIFNLCFLLTILSLTFTFFDTKDGRISFFIASYAAALGVVFGKLKLSKSEWYFIIALFVIGASKVIWFAIQYIGNPDFDIYNSYLASGKRLMIAAGIGLFLLGSKSSLSIHHEKLIRYGLTLAFIIASAVGLYQISIHADRVDFFQGRATDASYMYAGLAVALIFILLRDATHKSYMLGALLVFTLAYIMIFFTGTRNTFISFPVAISLVALLKFRHIGFRSFGIAIAALIIIISASYSAVIKPRIDATLQEYEIFEQSQGNEIGSLTTRMAMWKVGMQSFLAHPLGLSQEHRMAWFTQYVDANNRDKSALIYANVHLHDETMDTASLQGVFGLAALFFYYIVTAAVAWTQRNAALLSVFLIVLITGLTDVVFISRDQTIFFPALMIITLLWQNSRNIRLAVEHA